MKKITYYEAEDGKQFESYDECFRYERNFQKENITDCIELYTCEGTIDCIPISLKNVRNVQEAIFGADLIVFRNPNADSFNEIVRALGLPDDDKARIRKGSVLIYLDSDDVYGWDCGWYLIEDIIDVYNTLAINALKQTNLGL